MGEVALTVKRSKFFVFSRLIVIPRKFLGGIRLLCFLMCFGIVLFSRVIDRSFVRQVN